MTHDTYFVVGLVAGFSLSWVLTTLGLFLASLHERRRR